MQGYSFLFCILLSSVGLIALYIFFYKLFLFSVSQGSVVRPETCGSNVSEMASPVVSNKPQGQGSESSPQMNSIDAPTSDSKTWFQPEMQSPLPSQVSAGASIQSKDTGISLDSQSVCSMLPTENISGQSSAVEATLHMGNPTVGGSAPQCSSSPSPNSSGPSVLSWISQDACASFFGSLPSIQLLAQPCGLTSSGSDSGTTLFESGASFPYCLNFFYEIGRNRRFVVPPATPGYLLIPVGLRDSSLTAPGFVSTVSSVSSPTSVIPPPKSICDSLMLL